MSEFDRHLPPRFGRNGRRIPGEYLMVLITMSNDLEQILNGTASEETITEDKGQDSPEATEAEQATEPDQAVVEESQESEAKGETEREEKEEETPTFEQGDEKQSWTKKAVIDERRKRQEQTDLNKKLEQKIAELEQKIAGNLQGETETKEDEPQALRPDVLDDPEGAFTFTEKRLEKAMFDQKVALSREFMMDKHQDYEEVEKVFIEMSKENPSLSQQLYKANNPAKFAYTTAKNYQQMQQISDPNYVEDMKAQIRKEVLAELSQGQEPDQKPEIKLPKNLTKATSAKSGDKFPGDLSLEDILPE